MTECINSFEGLIHMSRKGEYELSNDIDCDGKVITSIIRDFSGKLNGEGHVIRNLILSDEIWGDEQTLALFYTMNRAVIKNVSFENIRLIYDKVCYKPRVAALVGSCSNSTICNVIMSVTINNAEEITMIYEANECLLHNNKILCNGKETTIAKFI